MRSLIPIRQCLALSACLLVATSLLHGQAGNPAPRRSGRPDTGRWTRGTNAAHLGHPARRDGKPRRLSGSGRGIQCRARKHSARRSEGRGVRLQNARAAPDAAGLHPAGLHPRPQVSGALSPARPGQHQHRMDAAGPRSDHHRQPAGRKQNPAAVHHRLSQRKCDRDDGRRKAGRPYATVLRASLS